MNSITIKGEKYPCHQTMGAWVLYKEMTGLEVGEEMGKSTAEACKFLYCTVKAACIGEDRPFDLDFIKFSCLLTPEVLQQWMSGNAEKKS